MTEGFWQSCARGIFLAEYPLVRRGVDCTIRLADAIILPDEVHRRGQNKGLPHGETKHLALTGPFHPVTSARLRSQVTVDELQFQPAHCVLNSEETNRNRAFRPNIRWRCAIVPTR